MDNQYSYTSAGMGGRKINKAMEARIDWIVDINRRRNECKAAGDLQGLLDIADEYEAHPKGRFRKVARVIRFEVAEMMLK